MATVLELITEARNIVGVSDSTEPLEAEDAQDSLTLLNDLLESWNLEHLMLYEEIRETFSLVASQSVYTMGTGANFNTSRPVRIERASMLVNNAEIPMKIINRQTYISITDKTATATYPYYLYVDGDFANANLTVLPVPTAVNTIVLYSWSQLTAFASIDATVSLPPGYSRALKYNLAIEIGIREGAEVPTPVLILASRSKADIKRANIRPNFLKCPVEVLGPRGHRPYFDGRADYS